MISSLILFGFFYYGTVGSELRRVDAEIVKELDELDDIYLAQGAIALEREVFLRSASGDGLYLYRKGSRVTGNMGDFPIESVNDLKLDEYRKVEAIYSTTDLEGSAIDRRMRGHVHALEVTEKNEALGYLLVGRDVEQTMRGAQRVKNTIFLSALISLFLGVLSAILVTNMFSSRIEQLNRLADAVRQGHLDRRAARNYSGDEFDLLSDNLNSMLDHIDTLMKAMRYAGDSIAHDLRSPLTRLRTRLESAAVELKEDDPAADVLWASAEDASELLSTFDSVLRIARLEAGERRELLKEIDPKPILDDIAELYEPACEDKGLMFSAHIEEAHLIAADRGLLSQAVSNLVENAIKYTPRGGELSLSLERNRSGRSQIIIRDSGPGIPESDRQRVKERFVRLDQSRTEKGSGLGLALVDAIADLHRADFNLENGIRYNDERPGLAVMLTFPRIRRR